MTRENIIQMLESYKDFIQKEFGVVSIGIFGSISKNNFSEVSDIDLIVEMEKVTYDKYAGLCLFLEKLLNKKVQVVLKSKYMNKEFYDRIKEEIIYV